MDVTDEALLSSGFTPSDLKKIKNNVESYGGTLGNAIRDWRAIYSCRVGCIRLPCCIHFSCDVRI